MGEISLRVSTRGPSVHPTTNNGVTNPDFKFFPFYNDNHSDLMNVKEVKYFTLKSRTLL